MQSSRLKFPSLPAGWRRPVYRRHIVGYLYIAPAWLFTCVFFILPLVLTLIMSLYNWPLLAQRSFIGLANYGEMLGDKQFWSSLWFTARYTLIVTPAIFIPAFFLALLVNQSLRGIGFFRTAYFIPVVIGLGTSSLLWIWMFNDRVGIFNGLLQALHLIDKPIYFLGDKVSAMISIVASVVWKTVGFSMVLLLMGMQAISEEIYQSAMVDGAGYWQKLYYITLPLLRRTFALALILSVIGSFLAFDQFYIMTQGGPNNQTISVVYWIFANSFTYFRMGYGAALSIILMVILLILSAIQNYLLRDERSS